MLSKFCRLLLCTTNILIMILLLSVAEPEPVGAEVFWLEPEPIFLGRLRLLFLASEKRDNDVHFSLYTVHILIIVGHNGS